MTGKRIYSGNITQTNDLYWQPSEGEELKEEESQTYHFDSFTHGLP
jgi:hypothetical protein